MYVSCIYIGRPDGMAEWQSGRLSFWEIGESEPRGFEPWLSQSNYFKIDVCYFLAKHFALLG